MVRRNNFPINILQSINKLALSSPIFSILILHLRHHNRRIKPILEYALTSSSILNHNIRSFYWWILSSHLNLSKSLQVFLFRLLSAN